MDRVNSITIVNSLTNDDDFHSSVRRHTKAKGLGLDCFYRIIG